MDGLRIRERTLMLVAVPTGLRQSELFGLKWGDIDSDQGTMNVTRSIVYGVVGPCKTESSQKPVPVHPLLADALSAWRKQCAYTKPDDWVFASRRYRGRMPYWGTGDLAQACSTGCAASWYPEMHRMAHVSPYLFDSAEKRGYGIQGDARAVAAFSSAIHIGYLHPSNHTCQTCSSGNRLVVGVRLRRMERHNRRHQAPLQREEIDTARRWRVKRDT